MPRSAASPPILCEDNCTAVSESVSRRECVTLSVAKDLTCRYSSRQAMKLAFTQTESRSSAQCPANPQSQEESVVHHSSAALVLPLARDRPESAGPLCPRSEEHTSELQSQFH